MLTASSGETLRQLSLQGLGIVCLSDFMTQADRRQGRLVQLLEPHTLEVRQPINAVYYRNAQLAARITCFLDFVAQRLSLDEELREAAPATGRVRKRAAG
jgi:DNA-binding transcriptional LysR family regulator